MYLTSHLTHCMFQIKSRLSLLRIQEQRLSGVFGEWQKIAADKMNLAQVRIKNAEKQVKT